MAQAADQFRAHVVGQYFGQRLRVAMAVADCNKTHLAGVLDVTPTAVGYWASGVRFPRSSQLVAISKELGCSIEWLMTPEPVDLVSTSPQRFGAIGRETLRDIITLAEEALAKLDAEGAAE